MHLLLTRMGFVVLSLSQFVEVFSSTEWRILSMQAYSDVLVSQNLTAHNATGMILCTSQMLIGSQVGLNGKMTSSWSGNTKWTFFILFNTDVHFNLLNVTTVVLSAAGWRTSNNTNSHSPHTGDSKLITCSWRSAKLLRVDAAHNRAAAFKHVQIRKQKVLVKHSDSL